MIEFITNLGGKEGTLELKVEAKKIVQEIFLRFFIS